MRIAACFAWWWLALVPSSARADSDDPDTEIARRHFQTGSAYYRVGDYKSALKEFEAARTIRPNPALDFNIGRCHDRLEHLAEAIAAYERYLSQQTPSPDVGEVRERVILLRERLQARPTPPTPVPTPEAPPPSSAPPVAPAKRVSPYLLPGVMAALTLSSAVVAVGLLGSIPADYDRLERSCNPCRAQDVDPLRQHAYGGYALLGLAGALAVTDVVLFVLAHRRQSRSLHAVGGGLTFARSF